MEHRVHFSTNIKPQRHPKEITPLDNWILQQGGTTSTIERLPHRARQAKTRHTTDQARIDELTWENSYLRAEIAQQEDVGAAFNDLRVKTVEVFKILRQALHDLSDRVEKSDQKKAGYWGFSLDGPVCEDVL
jgi:hypothetical protein